MAHHLLVISDPLARHLRLLEKLPDDTRINVSASAEGLIDAAPDADAVFVGVGGGAVLREIWPAAQHVRWVHSMAAGIDNLLFPELVASDVVVTNGRGVYRNSLGEFAVAAMLFFAKDLRRMVRSQERGIWDQFDVDMLAGATLGIVGYGEIGRAAAERAKCLGVRIIATRRRGHLSSEDGLLDRAYNVEDRREMIAASDYVLVAAALTPETRGLVGAAEIAAMKPTAVLMNLSRGAVVDEAALIDALEHRRIRGAALDVFNQEPLPPGHAFWRLDNVLLSPHTADHTATWLDESIQFFIENFERYEAGKELMNVVDKKAGY